MNGLSKRAAEVLADAGDGPAIEYEGRWRTWAEVRRLADGIAEALEASGADLRAPVVFIARSQPAAVAAFLALIRSGRTIRMVYPFQSAAGVVRDLQRLNPAVVVAAERDYAPEVRAAIHELGAAAIVIREMEAEALPGFTGSTARPAADPAGEPQIGILTSGTTGPPKQFAVGYEMLAKYFVTANTALFGGEGAAAEPPPALLYYPLGNISGLFSTLPALLSGQRMIVLERFSVQGWRDYIVRYRPASSGTPASVVQMILDADLPVEDLASLRYFSTGAAPLDPNVQRAFEARYGIPILLSYGATEFGGPVIAMTPDLHAAWGDKKFGSVGKPFGGAQVRIVDAVTEVELPPGEEGLIQVISPKVGPDWIRTSDLGVIDADGFLFHRGRADGAIIRGGFKLLPETIERGLLLHDAVSAAAVVGIPDLRLGQVPVAAVQLKPGAPRLGAAELEAHLREHVLATHIPARWLIVEDLPKTVSMKVDRPAVARMFTEALPT